ncbi:MAG: hypothetical protein D6734_08805 [Candidatus Schekmanbacteria bacterium]|nr:MAG: hypothetical protein D6734_08805 [Candidatus Schekmanbacteria bacterium]
MEISTRGKAVLDIHKKEKLYSSSISFFKDKVILYSNYKDFVDEFNNSFRYMVEGERNSKGAKSFYLYREEDKSFNLVLPSFQNLHFEGRDILFPLFTSLMNSFILPGLKDMLVFHSAAVSINDEGIIIPGEESTGKTTLTAALLEEGFTYFSDEYAGFDSNSLKLISYPKSLFMRDDSIKLFKEKEELIRSSPLYTYRNEYRWVVDPMKVFGMDIGKEVEVKFILFLVPNYFGKSAIKRIPSSEVLLRLLKTSRNSIYLKQEERKVFFGKALSIVKRTVGYELTVGRPQEAASIVKNKLMYDEIKSEDELKELDTIAEKVLSML